MVVELPGSGCHATSGCAQPMEIGGKEIQLKKIQKKNERIFFV